MIGRNISILLIILLACCAKWTPLVAQDSLQVNNPPTGLIIEAPTNKKKPFLKNYFKEDYPSPKKAITLAIVPGMGQIYNKRYWKLPLVYGALGGVIYLIDYNTGRYKLYRDAYATRLDDDLENLLPAIPTTALKVRRDGFDKNRQLSWIGLIGFYLISAGDAFVDAHLKDFNVDDNISIVPTIQAEPFQPNTIGLSITINLSK